MLRSIQEIADRLDGVAAVHFEASAEAVFPEDAQRYLAYAEAMSYAAYVVRLYNDPDF